MLESTIYQQVFTRAVKDEAFRTHLLANPRAALASEYNVQLSETTQVRVIEDDPNTLTIVIPSQNEIARELSDEELETIAGGAEDLRTALSMSVNYFCCGRE